MLVWSRDAALATSLTLALLGAALAVLAPFAVLMVYLQVPGGSLIPSLMMGALLGRFVGACIPGMPAAEQGVLALVGSASMLSAVTRMTITLLAILVEISDDVRVLPLIMTSLVVASTLAARYVPCKLALIGMTAWFEMGSTAQLTFGLLVCFFSFVRQRGSQILHPFHLP